MLLEYKGKLPKLGERVYIAEGAILVGDVVIGDHSSVWFNSVVRGDVNFIRIGSHTNIQDGSILHVMRDQYPLVLRDHVTIGHGVMLHGCEIESHCLIGMRATILNNAKVGAHSIVGAGVLGLPAKVKRELTDAEVEHIDEYSRRYYQYKETYLEMNTKPQ
jgi:carbonic anhydrase/acetyltransferase-like protein (isoleucine patch superfamily)